MFFFPISWKNSFKIMGTSGTKESPRNLSFQNHLLMTEAALQQLQSSLSKSIPTSHTDQSTSSKTSANNTPLPTIDTNGYS